MLYFLFSVSGWNTVIQQTKALHSFKISSLHIQVDLESKSDFHYTRLIFIHS